MPRKTIAPSETVAGEAEAPALKPRAPRRRTKRASDAAAPEVSAQAEAPRKTTRSKPAVRAKRQAAPATAGVRAKTVVAKLESALDQLEEALKAPAVETAVSDEPAAGPREPYLAPVALSLPVAPSLPALPPQRAARDDGWRFAAPPVLAACVFLALIGALIVGYSAGYSVRSGLIEAPGLTVVEASERTPEPVPATPEALVATPEALVAASEAPASEPAAARADEPAIAQTAAAPENSGGLHLQVSALRSRRAADALSRRLAGEGFPVSVREPGDDNLVRVLVGPAVDRHQLDAWSSRLRQEGLDPFPKTL